MKSTFLKYCFLVFVLLTVNSFSYTQNAQDTYLESDIQERKFAKENWEKVIEGIDYNEVQKKKEEDSNKNISDSRTSSPSRSPRSYSGESGNGAFWANFFKVLFIIIVIIVIAFIVSNFLGAGIFTSPKNRKVKNSDNIITVDNIEEHFHESDLDRFIREATAQGQYALAIRLYYLAIIKELSLSKAILWKKDKTNKDYIRELRKTNMSQSFREATSIFERVWYGEGELKELDYKDVKPKFEALIEAAKMPQV
jgi:hypothetical protein